MPYDIIGVTVTSDAVVEPEEELYNELPDDMRISWEAVSEDIAIEYEHDGDGWEPIATFDDSVNHGLAEYIGEALPEGYRVAKNWDGPWQIEKFVEVED